MDVCKNNLPEFVFREKEFTYNWSFTDDIIFAFSFWDDDVITDCDNDPFIFTVQYHMDSKKYLFFGEYGGYPNVVFYSDYEFQDRLLPNVFPISEEEVLHIKSFTQELMQAIEDCQPMEDSSVMRLEQRILEIFEEYLIRKGVEIDNPERNQSGEGACQICTEYGELEEQIRQVINDETCCINLDWHCFPGKVVIQEGGVIIQSESLQEYIDKYSME